MQTYLLQIDEAQREMLVRTLTKVHTYGRRPQDAEVMRSMLMSLPDDERKQPGIVHSLCS